MKVEIMKGKCMLPKEADVFVVFVGDRPICVCSNETNAKKIREAVELYEQFKTGTKH